MNPYLKSNVPLTLDYVFGIRAWGLILYGALPSSLAGLDILQVPDVDTLSGAEVMATVFLMFLPFVVLYLLVRQRLAAWYLLSDFASTRILAVTAGIFITSIFVALTAGLSDGTYAFPWANDWSSAQPHERWSWLLEASLSGSMALIVTSALFITAIKETGGLPTLPSTRAVEKLGDLKRSLNLVQINSNLSQPRMDSLRSELENASQAVNWLFENPKSSSSRRTSVVALRNDIFNASEALKQVEMAGSQWTRLFSAKGGPIAEGHPDKPKRDSVIQLKGLRLND